MTAVAGPLAARIARLEQIVSALQGQAGGGEALSANYLTLGPDGSVGAAFSGHISAAGLDMPEGAFGDPLSTIAWHDSSGATQESIGGGAGGGLHVLQLFAGQSAGVNALLELQTDGTNSSVGAGTNVAGVTVIDSRERSSFLQLADVQQTALSFGDQTLTWPGGSNNSNAPTISHGLPGVPRVVLATMAATSAGGFTWVNVTDITAATFQVQATTGGTVPAPAGGTTATCYWLAIS